jgi:hypothetical protein
LPVEEDAMSTRIVGLMALSAILAACESPQTAVPVQGVSIKADTFCPGMRRLRPPDGIPTWDLTDSQETVDYNRKLEAVVVKKCLKRSGAKP